MKKAKKTKELTAKKDTDPPLVVRWLALTLLLLLIGFAIGAMNTENSGMVRAGHRSIREESEPQWMNIVDNSLIPMTPSFIHKGQTLATMIESNNIPLTYETLINCLIHHESRGNPKAIGKAGEIGILQFKPSTWKIYCVDRYKFRDDIYSPELQKLCADQMLQENFANIRHWTTASKCLR